MSPPYSGTGWALEMLAPAYLTVIRHQAVEEGEKGATWAPTKNRFPRMSRRSDGC